jgi:hypothetical protein
LPSVSQRFAIFKDPPLNVVTARFCCWKSSDFETLKKADRQRTLHFSPVSVAWYPSSDLFRGCPAAEAAEAETTQSDEGSLMR